MPKAAKVSGKTLAEVADARREEDGAAARLTEAQKLIEKMMSMGLSSTQIAGQLGHHTNTVDNWRKGNHTPSAAHIIALRKLHAEVLKGK